MNGGNGGNGWVVDGANQDPELAQLAPELL